MIGIKRKEDRHPPAMRRPASVCAAMAAGLMLAGCAISDIPFVKDRVGEVRGPDPKTLSYPTFGTISAPTSDKPVLDDAGQKKMQDDLQNVAKQRESQKQQELEENAGQ